MTVTPAERDRLAVIKRELDALYAAATARPAPAIEVRIEENMRLLAEVEPGQRAEVRDLLDGLAVMLRMSPAEKSREARLISEWNDIARAARVRRADARQAKVNAREVARVRAAACPTCFATHAGECV